MSPRAIVWSRARLKVAQPKKLLEARMGGTPLPRGERPTKVGINGNFRSLEML